MKPRSILICAILGVCLGAAHAQLTPTPAPTYDALIQQGKAQLQAGNSAQALASGQQAVQLDATRWEAYALAGGALMNLKRYEEAEDQFSHAIDHAPAAKQDGLRALRRQCAVAESGTPPAASQASPASQPAEASTSQAEIVLWKTIESSANPDDFDAYLKQYPNGAFVALATQRSQSIRAAAQAAAKKQQDDAARAEEAKRDQIPAVCRDKICGNSYGHLLITSDGVAFTGDRNFQFSKSDAMSVNVKCNPVYCQVDMAFRNGEMHSFIAMTEEAIATRKERLKFLAPAALIINRIRDQWGWVQNGKGKGKDTTWLTPPSGA